MGGTLTNILFVCCRPECRWEKSYIGALLGPERTRECFLYRKVTIRFECQADRTISVVGMVLAGVRAGCVV